MSEFNTYITKNKLNQTSGRFTSLDTYCKNTFGEKVYRLSLDGGCSCPNRDGKLSHGGCIFCSSGGSGDFAANATLPIKEQMDNAKELLKNKTNCSKFIAYFQAYTGTYGPIEHLRKMFYEAIMEPDIVALSIATRCDCLPPEVLDLLEELNQIKPVWIELGLQTIHNEIHAALNTFTTVESYEEAAMALSARGISVISHVILGLPGETKEMMLDTIRHVGVVSRKCTNSPMTGIKIHMLHVLKDTNLASYYMEYPFPLFELEEYCDFVVDCIELLPPDMVIHRLTGDGPRALLIAPLWSTDKKRVLNTIQKRLKERDTWQGRLIPD